MKKYLFLLFFGLICSGGSAIAQEKSTTDDNYCKCIEQYSYDKHRDDFATSDYKCFRAWKKEMKRKKKECQAKALEGTRPMAARRKRREAERKVIKRDAREQEHAERGNRHDYWY